jgi:3-oxoadipate enol-lactonase
MDDGWKGGAPSVQFAEVNGVTIHHQVIGAAGMPLIVFVNSLGTDFRIWRDVVVRLAGDFSVLLYDKRGHGLSETGATPYSIATLAADLAALMDRLGHSRALICGLSVGGLIAQQLWATRPDLVAGLILCDTAHKIGTDETWNPRIAAIEADGIEAVADGVMTRWFSPAFLATAEAAGYRNMLTRQPVDGYVATCVAIRDADFTAIAPSIDVPAIVIVGEHDGSTPPKLCADFAKLIPGARFELIKGAGHIPPVEKPEVLAEIIRAFAALTRERVAADVRH